MRQFIANAIMKYDICDNNYFLSVGLTCGGDFSFVQAFLGTDLFLKKLNFF